MGYFKQNQHKSHEIILFEFEPAPQPGSEEGLRLIFTVYFSQEHPVWWRFGDVARFTAGRQ